MAILSRWLAPAMLAAGLGIGAMTPAPAQAQDLTRVLVDIADVVLRGGQPYYRHGDYGHDDRLIAVRDRYGRVVYYRNVPPYVQQRSGPPYGNAHGYYRNGPGSRHGADGRKVKCNKHGKCKVTYYDPRHDRSGYDERDAYDRYYGTRGRNDDDDRYWDGRRWRERDDD